MKLLSLSLLLALFIASGARAAGEEAPSAEAAERYAADFELRRGRLGPSSPLNKKILAALHLLESGEFSEEEAGPLEFRADASPDYEYFQARITGLRHRGCSGGEQVVACVHPGSTEMHLEDYFFELPTVNQAGTLVHEARHVDGFPHITCEDGPLAGSPGGCDPSLAYRGSYAVELGYYARVALRGRNFHPAYKALARAAAVSLMEQNFVKAPVRPRERLALVSQADGHLILFDGEKFQERNATVVDDAKLIARNYGLAVLPKSRGERSWLVDPYSREALPQETLESLLGTTLRSYNKLAPAERPILVDILNRRDLQARLYGDRLEIMLQPENGEVEPTLVNIPTSGLGLKKFAAESLCWRPDPIQGRPRIAPVQLLAEGRIYQVKNLRSYEAEPLLEPLPCALPADLEAAVEFNGRYLGLLRSGEIVELARDGGEARPYAPLAGVRAREMVAVPLYAELE